MSFVSFPPELLECIVREIDPRDDLLALAQTCSRLRDAVVPNHLNYRTIRASTYHVDLWNHLLNYPNLAANVRALTLYVGHPEAFVPIFRDEPRVTWHAPAGTADYAGWSGATTDTLSDVFRLLRNTNTLNLHVSWVPDEDELQDVDAFHSALGVLDASCTCLPALDDLTVCAPGIYEQEPAKDEHLAVWRMSKLRKIDFHAFGQPVFTYSGMTKFCEMLRLSTTLEELHVSMDVHILETLADNPLRRLKHFYVYNVGAVRLGDEEVAMRFLEAHPSLETLQLPRLFKDWQSSFSKPILPNIKALLELPQVFLRCVFGGRASGSLDVHTLGDFVLDNGTLPLLRVIDPSRLRRVRLAKLDTLDTLHAFAKMFPAIEELSLPPPTAHEGKLPPPPALVQRVRGHVRAMRLALRGGHVRLQPHWRALRLHDVVVLFPRLNTISFVQTPLDAFVPFLGDVPGWGCVYYDQKSKDVRRVRAALDMLARRYPGLIHINGWCVCSLSS